MPRVRTKQRGARRPLEASRLPSFLRIVQVHPGLNIVTIAPPVPFLGCLQIRARFISPATFREKRVPDGDFLIARSSAALKAPLKNFLIRTAFERSIDKLVVNYAEKSCATRVEHCRIFIDASKIIRRQFASGL